MADILVTVPKTSVDTFFEEAEDCCHEPNG